MSEVRRSDQDGIAVLTLSNPPVNGLGQELRAALFDALQQAIGDPAIRAIVLEGEGRMFCAGADIRQFGTPKVHVRPITREVFGRIEASTKPVVAALHGHALGGGLELSMACHARVAAEGTQLALPEVRLGILPGGGGTQRLPRLIGVERALELMVSGDRLSAQQALGLGLVDEVVPPEQLLARACALAARLASEGEQALAQRRTTGRAVALPAGSGSEYWDAARTRLAANHPDDPAPLEILDCVRAAVEQPVEQALDFERARVLYLQGTEQSARKRSAFLSKSGKP